MRDIIFITSDSLRASNMSVYGYKRKTTPFLEELSKESIVFTNAFSVGPSSASMSGTLTSTIPLTEGAYFSIPEELQTIAETLPDDYSKLAVHSHGLFAEETGFHAGFDEFIQYDPEIRASEEATSKLKSMIKSQVSRSDFAFSVTKSIYRKFKKYVATPNDPRVEGSRLLKGSQELLADAQSPVFLWIHLMDTHSPFVPESEILEEFAPDMTMRNVAKLIEYRNVNEKVDPDDERVNSLINTYDAEIQRTDSLLESFIKNLETIFKEEPPVYIISADHGEAFGEHGWIGHPAEALYDETLWIPLIIHDPDSDESRTDSTIVSSLDIGATICNLADTTIPKTFRGESLLETGQLDREGVYSLSSHERRWVLNPQQLRIRYRTDDWSYLYKASGSDELYRSRSQENVIDSLPEVADHMRSRIDPILEEVTYPSDTAPEISEGNKERLRDLGYLVE